MAKTNIKELSIQVNLNGLSFCILNRSLNTIEYINTLLFKTKLSPIEVLDRLKTELSTNLVFSDDFTDVLIIHQNELATLVPAAYFNEDIKADYLKFNSKILRTDYITYDDLPINKSVNVYVPYVNINNYIFDTFGEFIFKHASSILVDAILQTDNTKNPTRVHLNVNQTSLECIVVKDKQLHLLNYFEFHTKEDFIYYILFVFEQLGLDVETTPVVLSGLINVNDELFTIVYKYIRHVSFVDSAYNYKFSDDIHLEKVHEHFLILNSF